MRYLLIVVFVLLSNAFAWSQDSVLIRHKPRHALKISPVHILGFYPTLQVAYEMGLSDRVGVQVDAGIVLNYRGGTSTDYQNKRGTKLKAELRYYFESLPQSADGFYVSVEPYLNRVNFDRSGTTTECFDPQCQSLYTRYFSYGVKYREYGVSAKGGYMIFFDKHILLDVTIGWSLRDIQYDQPPNTVEMIQNNFLFFGPNEEDRVVLSPLVGVRLGYRLR